MRNRGSQRVLFCPHFIRTEKGSLPGQKAAFSGRTRWLAGKRDPGYRGQLIAESACRRSSRVKFSWQKDAWALLPLPFSVKTKALPEPLSWQISLYAIDRAMPRGCDRLRKRGPAALLGVHEESMLQHHP